MKLGLIISNDWELFGDGSGDYFEIQHRRLEQLLQVIEEHNAKLTVMADVGQQWAHQKIATREAWAQNVAEAWEAILKETIKRKHDVQLHLHPQWLNAEYKDNKWYVDLNNWAISSLSPEIIANVLIGGKLYLDNTLKPVDPAYECIAFRAGAYCIEPSKVVIENLLKAGIICDTSVIKGKQNLPFFDYRDAYSNCIPWFTSSKSVKYRGNKNNGLLELPIFSFENIESPIVRKVTSKFLYNFNSEDKKWFQEKSSEMMRIYPFHKRPFQENNFYEKSLIDKMKSLFLKFISKKTITLDYDNISQDNFVREIEKIFSKEELSELRKKDIIIPVMCIGHVKVAHNCENIKRILNRINISLKGQIIYWTLSDAIRYWINEVVKFHAIW